MNPIPGRLSAVSLADVMQELNSFMATTGLEADSLLVHPIDVTPLREELDGWGEHGPVSENVPTLNVIAAPEIPPGDCTACYVGFDWGEE